MDLMNFAMVDSPETKDIKVDNGCLGRGESFVAPNSTQVITENIDRRSSVSSLRMYLRIVNHPR